MKNSTLLQAGSPGVSTFLRIGNEDYQFHMQKISTTSGFKVFISASAEGKARINVEMKEDRYGSLVFIHPVPSVLQGTEHLFRRILQP